MQKPIIDSDQLIQAILAEDPHAIDACLAGIMDWEDNVMSGVVLIRTGPDEYDRFLGVQMLASHLRGLGDMVSAMALAGALFAELRKDPVVLSAERLDLTMMTANLIDVMAGGLTEIGQSEALIQAADEWAVLLEQIGAEEYFPVQVRLCQIEASLMSGRYDHARNLLATLAAKQLHPTQIPILQRLAAKLPVVLRAADEPEPPPVNIEAIVNQSLMALQAGHHPDAYQPKGEPMPPMPPMGIDAMPELSALAAEFGFVPDPLDLTAMIHQVEQLEQARNPNSALMAILNGLGAFFQDDLKSQDHTLLMRLAQPMERTARYAGRLGFWEHEMSTRWLLAVSLKRLERFAEAAAMLRLIRDEIDRKRMAVNDPRNRAGISVYLKHLYAVSAEVLSKLGDDYNEELFYVIEGAKSKILAELTGGCRAVNKDATFLCTS